MRRRTLPLLIIPLFVACGDNSSQPHADASVTADQGFADSGVKADVGHPDAMALIDSGVIPDSGLPPDTGVQSQPACQQQLTFEQHSSTFPGGARDHHATFIVDENGQKSLVVAGGTNYSSIMNDTWKAPINADGSLGTFVQGARLPFIQSGQGVATVGKYTYLIGGRDRSNFLNKVIRTQYDTSGAFTGYEDLTATPQPRFHGSAAENNGFIYFSGGLQRDGTATDTLQIAELDSNGLINKWNETKLPKARSHHSSWVDDNYLYLAFGFEGNAFNNSTTYHQDISRAPINADGTLGAFEIYLGHNLDIATHATTMVDRCAFLFGGIIKNGTQLTRNNRPLRIDHRRSFATIAETGNPHQVRRSHLHQVPHLNGKFYLVGGSEAHQQVVNSIEIGRLSDL